MRRILQYQKFKGGTHVMTSRTIARSNIELLQRQTSVLMRQDNQIGCMGSCLLLCHGGQSYRQTNMPCTFASIANTQYYHYQDTLDPSIFINWHNILIMIWLKSSVIYRWVPNGANKVTKNIVKYSLLIKICKAADFNPLCEQQIMADFPYLKYLK